MGSLNEILGGILGNLGGGSRSQASGSPQASGQDGGNSLLKLAMQLIQKHGGVGGLLNKIK
ncbi:MAG: hypothetical protein SGI88_14040, partial [Candidatus Hydrogenedentes bacterium]|nr:hypothetical protein [Candidatus Hydrogenedentota bacterium]